MHIKFIESNNKTRKVIHITEGGKVKLIQPESLGISQQDILIQPYGNLISEIKRKIK